MVEVTFILITFEINCKIKDNLGDSNAFHSEVPLLRELEIKTTSLLRPLVSVQKKCTFQCKWVSLMRPVTYYDHLRQVPRVVLLSGFHCIS